MRGLFGCLTVIFVGACADKDEAPAVGVVFRDVTLASGLDFVHDAGASELKHLPETMGHGAVLFDPDEDGDLDLYLVQSGALLPLSAGPPRNRLFVNDGAGVFRDGTSLSGAAADPGYGMGAAVGDADGDGHTDLYVTNFAHDRLLLGDGSGSFRDATVASGVLESRWTSGAGFFDAEWDGDLDLFVTAYVAVDLQNPAWCGRREPGWRTVCHPDRYEGLQDRLWRNAGNGHFENATDSGGVSDSFGKGLGVVTSDLDDDGFIDLYVANDSVENRLWRNQGDGSFIDDTLLSGTGVNRYGMTEAGMGLASGDVDGDGDFDLYVTNFDHESNTLYRNDGDGLFTDATHTSGLEATTRMPVGFGTLLFDFDNDSDLDIAVVNGHIVDLIERYHDGQTYRQPPLLFENLGSASFVDVSARSGEYWNTPRVGRSLVTGDIDGDGDLDLVATECGGATVLLRNETLGPGGVFLDGLEAGMRVVATLASGRVLHREAGPQPSYLGQSSPSVHLGTSGRDVHGLELRRGSERFVLSVEPPLRAGRYRLMRSGDSWLIQR